MADRKSWASKVPDVEPTPPSPPPPPPPPPPLPRYTDCPPCDDHERAQAVIAEMRAAVIEMRRGLVAFDRGLAALLKVVVVSDGDEQRSDLT